MNICCRISAIPKAGENLSRALFQDMVYAWQHIYHLNKMDGAFSNTPINAGESILLLTVILAYPGDDWVFTPNMSPLLSAEILAAGCG